MARVLALTSPTMKGADVRHLQEALKKNSFDKDYLPDSKPDGEFGPLTAQAVYRAQFWLGYVTPTQSCGTLLPKRLRGELTLTPAMRDKRKYRLSKAQADAPMRVKAFREALTHVGVKESPANSNMQKFGKWYGWNGVAWCAMFVSYCYAAAGSKRVAKQKRWAYCPYMVSDARAGQNGLTVTRNPKQGDIVLFDWEGDGVANHVELFDEWISKGSTFKSLGGNTSPTNASNGGTVYHYGVGNHLSRNVKNVIVFARLSS